VLQYNILYFLSFIINSDIHVFCYFLADSERKIIREGMDMIEAGSCFKFRPFKIGDFDFVLVQGASTGCWSYVGKRGGGQVIL
jgi:hypothetical protein